MTKGSVIVAVFLILCSLPSCQTHTGLAIYQSETLSVMLRELPIGYPPLAPYQHSYPLPSNEVFIVLDALKYDASSVMPFSSGQPRRVFSRHQAEVLAHELSNGLSQATTDTVVAFAIADEEKPDRRTKGFVFVANDELHLIIEELRKPLYEGEQKTYQQPISRWELLPGDRQRHYATRVGGKGAITNWIIIPLP
ncbi:MAG: hypothetical protein KF876_08515 [Nitrospira sp.]|nr:hypothetical protein [Nitrospira sp.]